MQLIEEGDFFKLSTDQQIEAAKEIQRKLRNRSNWTWKKGNAIQYLYEEDIYKQKKDCKDFIKNLVRSSNFEVVSSGRDEIKLQGKIDRENVVTQE